MFCSNCGTQNNDGARFCRNCGHPLGTAAPVEAVEQVTETVDNAATAAAETMENVENTVAEAENNAAETVENVATEAVAAAGAAEQAIEETAGNVVVEAEATALEAAQAVEAQAEAATESVAAEMSSDVEKASDIPVEAAAVAAVTVAAVAEPVQQAAEAIPQPQQYAPAPEQIPYVQPPQQYAPQQGQYVEQPQQYAPQQSQYVQQPQQGQYAQQPQQGQYIQQPQYQQQPAPVQAPPVQPQGYYTNNNQQPPKPKKKAGVGRVLLTIILSLFLIIAFTVCIVEYVALKSITKDTITDALKQVDISEMVVTSDDEDISLVEMIEEKADVNIAKEFDIDDEQLEAILDMPAVKEFISENVSDMAESILNGEEPKGISKKTIVDYVKKNKKSIYKDLQKMEGFEDITMEDIENFEEEHGDKLDEVFDSIGTDSIDMDFITDEAGFDIARITKMIPIIKWIAPGLAAFLILLMLIGNIGYESLTGKGVGISAMIAGIITAGGAIAFKYILQIPDVNVIKVLVLPLMDMFMIVGGIVFGAGLLLLIITCIIKAIANRARA